MVGAFVKNTSGESVLTINALESTLPEPPAPDPGGNHLPAILPPAG
jgi:hypothetical protein